jgi:hypothetical protein
MSIQFMHNKSSPGSENLPSTKNASLLVCAQMQPMVKSSPEALWPLPCYLQLPLGAKS